MSDDCVLDEDDALELLAYLITAARTQVDEAAEYGPMRLLTAAHRLGDMIASRASEATGALVNGPLQRMPLSAVPRDDQTATSGLSTRCAAPSPRTSAPATPRSRRRHE